MAFPSFDRMTRGRHGQGIQGLDDRRIFLGMIR